MEILAAVIPLVVAVFAFASRQFIVTWGQRLRSTIDADLELWEKLEPGPDKDAFLKMIKGNVRRVITEESAEAHRDRANALVVGVFALTGGVLGGAAALTSGIISRALWMFAVTILFIFFLSAYVLVVKTVDRRSTAHPGKQEAAPAPKHSALLGFLGLLLFLSWLTGTVRRLRG